MINYPLCKAGRAPIYVLCMNWLNARSNDIPCTVHIHVPVPNPQLCAGCCRGRTLSSALCVYFVVLKREDKGRWLVTFAYNVRIMFTEIDNTVHINLGPNLCTGSLHSRSVQNHEFSITKNLRSDEEKNLFKKEDT
jgi:hypothetical protein